MICNHEHHWHIFVPFKNPAHKTDRDPKYAFHIKLECRECSKYLGFAKQTEELMESLKNNTLTPPINDL